MANIHFDSTRPEVIAEHFRLWEQVLNQHDLKDKPGQLYNMNESGRPISPNPPNVIAKRGQKKVRQCTSGKKTQITVVGSASASRSGSAIPTMVIFAAKNLNIEWTTGESARNYLWAEQQWLD